MVNTNKKKEIAVLISGYGSNLQAIIDSIKNNKLAANIALVASNKKDAYGLTRASNENIRTFVSKSVHEIFNEIEKLQVDIIVLAGFMKIIPADIVQKFKGKIINIHPSLLPKYRGLNAIKRAYDSLETETGVTIHYVDEDMDTGKIVAQERVKIEEDDTLSTLEKKIHDIEHKLYPSIIAVLIKN